MSRSRLGYNWVNVKGGRAKFRIIIDKGNRRGVRRDEDRGDDDVAGQRITHAKGIGCVKSLVRASEKTGDIHDSPMLAIFTLLSVLMLRTSQVFMFLALYVQVWWVIRPMRVRSLSYIALSRLKGVLIRWLVEV